ncbi:sensor histidine kinase [Agromyces soli]
MEHDRTGRSGPGDGLRGILAPVARFDRLLHVVLLVLLVTCALRYLERHGLGPQTWAVFAGAAALAAVASLRPLLPRGGAWPTIWVGAVVVLWMALTLAAPSFAWCAVPLAFAVLRVIRFGIAVGVVVVMSLVVSIAELRLEGSFDPTLVVGPAGIAIATVVAYRALERESAERQRLLDELTAAQDELATEQHRAGALAERTRLSREIHDSVGQQLSSINLLLQAAEQDWTKRPEAARAHVATAAATAREGLDEVRRVVRDLAPAALDDGRAEALPEALARLVTDASAAAGSPAMSFRRYGEPRAVPAQMAAAVLRSANGAVANALEHARAARVAVSLTYLPDELRLDVRDDGSGFDASALAAQAPPAANGAAARGRSAALRGHGLRGLRERAAALGGRAEIESAPGEGTSVSVSFPLEAP